MDRAILGLGVSTPQMSYCSGPSGPSGCSKRAPILAQDLAAIEGVTERQAEIAMQRQDKDAAYEAINALDFTLAKQKLMLPPEREGQGWTQEQTDTAELWYKRYLKLCWLNRDLSVVPTVVIDKFWHQHILDTQRYGDDCLRIFGHMLHHYPYSGMTEEENMEWLECHYDATQQMYEDEFGEICPL